MHRFFVSSSQIVNNLGLVIGDDARQIRSVLKLSLGERIMLLDGSGMEYEGPIVEVNLQHVQMAVESAQLGASEPSCKITLMQALIKAEKMESVFQKGTQLGATRFRLLQNFRSIVKLHPDEADKKRPRWERILKEAAEQSQRCRIPAFDGISTWRQHLANWPTHPVLMLHPCAEAVPLGVWRDANPDVNELTVMVGPEGGYTEQELSEAQAKGAMIVTMGPRVLRTELAGPAMLARLLIE